MDYSITNPPITNTGIDNGQLFLVLFLVFLLVGMVLWYINKDGG